MQTNQTKPLIVAQSTSSYSSPSQQQPDTSFPIFPVAMAVVVIVMLLSLWSQRDKLIKWLSPLLSSEPVNKEISSQEFAVDIEVLNIRTQDYLRAKVQATIYVFVANNKEDKQKAQRFLAEGESVSTVAVENAVRKRAEAAIRGSASEKTLNELHTKRAEVSKAAKERIGNCLSPLGLNLRELVIGEIEESANYSPNNYFDAQALKARTEVIQPVIFGTRKIELETEEKIREQELNTEKLIREQELDIGKNIRIKELDIGIELERKEVKHQHTSLENLEILEKVEEIRIDHELSIELYRNKKEKELQKQIETAELNFRKETEIAELKVKQELESLRTQTEHEIQYKKISLDKELIDINKEFQKLQAKAHQEIEKDEIAAVIEIVTEEQKRLEIEAKRSKAEEAVTAVIEEAKALRQQRKAKIAADSVEDEAKAIERLAQAEGKRYQAIPPTDADRTAQIIRELAPKLIEKLPQVAEVVKALGPQPGILGDSNIYTFSNGNGEDLNKLMSSTNGILLVQSLLEGKLGQLLGQSLRPLKNNSEDNEHI